MGCALRCCSRRLSVRNILLLHHYYLRPSKQYNHTSAYASWAKHEFAVPSVRAGLRKFLSTLNNPVVHMKLFRQGTSSCAGYNTRINHNVCARMEAQRFNMSSSEIMSEFPMATLVELEDSSSCKAAEVSQHACCQTYLQPHLHLRPSRARGRGGAASSRGLPTGRISAV